MKQMHFDKREAAEARLKNWKEELPEVESAYKPSGRITVKGVLWMILGALAAIPGGAVAGVGFGIAVFLIAGGLPGILFGLVGFAGWATILIFIGVSIGTLAAFGIAGYAAGKIVTIAGEYGKNRNFKIVIVFSIIPTALLLFLVWWWNVISINPGVDIARWWRITIYVIGSIAALILAGISAKERVANRKFCESCNEYMTKHNLRGLTYNGTIKFVKTVTDNNIDEALQIIQKESGNRGLPKLYLCPGCRRGYIEIEIQFKASYRIDDKNESDKEEKWMVCSVPIDSGDGQEFLRFKVKK